MRRGNLRGADEIVKAAIGSTSPVCESNEIWDLHFLRARILDATGQTEAAVTYLKSLLPPSSDLLEARSKLCNYLASYEGYLGRYQVADQLFSEALNIAGRAGLYEVVGDIHLAQAFIYFRKKDYRSSDGEFRLALEISERVGGWYLRGHGLWGIGKNLMIQEHYQAALPWLDQALEVFVANEEPLYVAMVWSELGVCRLGLGSDVDAMDLFRRAEKVYFEAGIVHNYQVVLANIGNVYLHRGDYLTAISYYQRALAMAREIKDRVSIKKWTRNINLAYARIKLSVDSAHPRIA